MPPTVSSPNDLTSFLEAAQPTAPMDAQSIRQLLEAARQRLRMSQMPHFFKVTTYVKICCLAIQHQVLVEQHTPLDSLYHLLSQWLWECEPDWWDQCVITETCKLTSSNARVNDLLRPLENFVEQLSRA